MNRIIIIFTILEIHKNLWKTNDSIQSIQGNRYKLAEVKTLKVMSISVCVSERKVVPAFALVFTLIYWSVAISCYVN